MKSKFYSLVVALCLLTTVISSSIAQVKDNQLSSQEQKEGYKLLFDGKSTKGWHLYNQGKIASVCVAKNGELKCTPGLEAAHGDLVTDGKFENYELKFDWKISKEGNSGVFINVLERADIPTAWASGPEYQLLEKSHQDYNKEMKRSGCLYNFSKQLNNAELKPLGSWNKSVIKQKNGVVEFYLNGVLTARQDFKTKEWKEAIAATSFNNFPEFGKFVSGQIALQDWNKGVAFKNIKIKNI